MVPIVKALVKGPSSIGAFLKDHTVIKRVSIITTNSHQKLNNRFEMEKTC